MEQEQFKIEVVPLRGKLSGCARCLLDDPQDEIRRIYLYRKSVGAFLRRGDIQCRGAGALRVLWAHQYKQTLHDLKTKEREVERLEDRYKDKSSFTNRIHLVTIKNKSMKTRNLILTAALLMAGKRLKSHGSNVSTSKKRANGDDFLPGFFRRVSNIFTPLSKN